MNQPASLPPLSSPETLVRAMSKLQRRLAEDLRRRAADARVDPSLREAWAADRKQGRTGEPFETYRDAFCDQVAASWILCAVFARTLEDRGYLSHRLAGPGAAERHAMFRSSFKYLGDRDYLLHVFDAISLLPGGKEVFGPGHAPLWRLGPSSRAIGELLDELRAMEGGQLRFTFGRPAGEAEHEGASTRYLGDLYQNLNEDVRKRYALLQTPDFVERFLLDNTLDPAIRERGIAVTVLDPACGSGHLLLGAYDRLFDARLRAEPGRSLEETARRALSQVFGVDLNPYAAAVARFRLLLSYLDKARIFRLSEVPEDLRIQVYVGDSLLAGVKELQAGFGDLFARQGKEVDGFDKGPLFSLFDSDADVLLKKTRFDVVVANPPYITEKDAAKRDLIRKHYKAAAGTFSLAAPFAERVFKLANDGGYTGQITANSFMKREFGKALVEEVLPKLDLTQVIDTSGAYIPGHGTPTVILFGRAQRAIGSKVRVVMASRGEPETPQEGQEENGKVWSSIAAHFDEIGFENEFISVTELDREKFGKHPWSIGGGGSVALKDLFEAAAKQRLSDIVELPIGRAARTGADEIMALPVDAVGRVARRQDLWRDLLIGEELRDWSARPGQKIWYPYNPSANFSRISLSGSELQILWPWKTTLAKRATFQGIMADAGLAWYEYMQYTASANRTNLSISFAFVSTHNHFILDRGGKVFNRSAPIIKLPEGKTEDEHLALLGYLNSSTACFWMKQVMANKAGSGMGRGIQSESWMDRYEFSGTALGDLPIPKGIDSLTELARRLDTIALKRLELSPRRVIERAGSQDVAKQLGESSIEDAALLEQMSTLQEELDWAVYELCGLASVRGSGIDIKRLRAFEFVLAREGKPTDWFERHGRKPLTEIPRDDLSASAIDLLERRIALIERDNQIGTLESTDYKRRWVPDDRAAQITEACESFLLDQAESFFKEKDPRPLSIRPLAFELNKNPKIRAVAEVLTNSSTFDLETLLADLLLKESIPSATCQVYTDEGIETRRAWERVWELQRKEDAGEKVSIEPPPKYDQKDFENAATAWRLRGKLDVPKERFIAYPTATPPPGAAGKAGLFFGWAGWDHLQKLQAAIELWQEEMGLHAHELIPRATRKDREDNLGPAAANDEGLSRDAAVRQKLLPILQTMVDLLPWVRQWHDEDGETASAFEAYVSEEARKLEVSLEEARLYRRPARTATRGRRAATASAAAAAAATATATATASATASAAASARVLEAVREGDSGEGVAVAGLGEKLGMSAAAVKKVVDGLLEEGKIKELKKRPRVVAVAG